MEKILFIPVLLTTIIFGVGGFIYAHADQLRLSRRAEMLAGIAFVGGGVVLVGISVVALVLRILGWGP